MSMHSIFINGSDTPTIRQPASHTWRPARGQHSWKIVDEQGVTVESYSPPRVSRAQPITRVTGSWAALQRSAREGQA